MNKKMYAPAGRGWLKPALYIGLASTFVLSAGAQSTSSGQSAETIQLEEFTVTGSHIPTTETAFDARTTPVDIVRRADFERLGFTTAEELLQSMPYAQSSVPPQNNQTGFTPAASSVNLRGIGSEATLVLLNGRRVAPYPRGHSGTVAFVDINSFPLSSIEQVEVLKDGASASYGADAVAGVVNIKTRKRFNGAEATVRYGNTFDKDAGEITGNFIAGSSTNDINMVVGANYFKRNDILHGDREFSKVPPFLSSNSSPLNFQITRAAAAEALGQPVDAPITGVPDDATLFFTATWENRDQNMGDMPASAYQFGTGRLATYNFNEQAQATPGIERKGGFFTVDKRMFGTENVHLYGELYYQRSDAQNELAPSATGNFANPGGVPLVIPARTANPILTPNEEAAGSRTAAEGAYNPFNPFNQDFSGGTRARLAEFGNRVYRMTNQALATAIGVRGDRVLGNWSWDLSGNYSQVQAVSRNSLVSISKFNRVLNAADPFFDPNSDQYIGTTVPYNPFGYYRNPIETNSLVVDSAKVELKDRRESELYGGNFTVSNGELFNMPGGSAGFAAGLDYRWETMLQSPDEAGSTGDVIGSSTDNTTNATRQIGGAFAEIELPIFGEDNAVPGAYRLGINLAGRYEDFQTQNDSIFVPKVSVRWMPIDDSFVVRGSWGEGYRQPTMYELYAAGLTYALTPITDPVTGVLEPEQDVAQGSNPQLKAEESENLSLGFVWTPNFLRKSNQAFTFGIDYWRIERNGNVDLDEQDVVNRDYNGEPLLPGEGVQRDASGNIVLVNAIFRNVGNEKAQGLDFQASYFYATENAGRFDVRIDASYLDSYEIQRFEGAPFFEYKGEMKDITYDNVTGIPVPSAGDDGYLEWRGRINFGWSKGAMTANLNGLYRDGFRDFTADWDGDPTDPTQVSEVDSTLIWDLVLSYNLFKGAETWLGDTRFSVGITNIFDTDPPPVFAAYNNSSNYAGHLYTPAGRSYFISLTKKL